MPSPFKTLSRLIQRAKRHHSAQNHMKLLPTEIIQKICTHLHPRDVDAMSLVCQFFRTSIISLKQHCNDVIRTRFAYEDALFASQLIHGWLVPSVSRINSCTEARWFFSRGLIMRQVVNRDPRWIFYMAGPEYAAFLEHFSRKFRGLANILLRICRNKKPQMVWDAERFQEVILRWAMGDRAALMTAIVRKVRADGTMECERLGDNLPLSVRAFLRAKNDQ